MDWYLDAREAASVSALRHEVMDYLRRHADPGSDLESAELAVSELLANVHRHAKGPAWVSLEWGDESPEMTVQDLGPGFDLSEVRPPGEPREGGWGLHIVSRLAERLEVAAKRAGGARVSARLPVRRASDRSVDPLPTGRPEGVLPAPEEAGSGGTFGKESFLRALVVQLSQSIEMQEGPEAAERSVTSVGLAVGGRMEEAYRSARGIEGTLTPEQMADLYVQLKGAIDGGFYVIEANEDRIVLGNTRCPFGPVVQKSPALCRMTSSVFGGIAARNVGTAAVQLEERIAVGDSECRVVVWLRRDGRDLAYAHAYETTA